MEVDDSSMTPTNQIVALEQELMKTKDECTSWKQRSVDIEEKLLHQNISIRSDLLSRLESVAKQCEIANKDKEAMVIKYATAEREVLQLKKERKVFEKLMKDSTKDKDILQFKIKSLTHEKGKINSLLDNKVEENGVILREIDKLKEALNSVDIKNKWRDIKLQNEIEAHQETQKKLERQQKHEEEVQHVKVEATNFVHISKSDETSHLKHLDTQLNELKAMLIMEKQKNDDQSSALQIVLSERDLLKIICGKLENESIITKSRTKNFELEREETNKLISSMQEEIITLKQNEVSIAMEMCSSESLTEQIESFKNELELKQHQMEDLEIQHDERGVEIVKCREKEAELLVFTKKLTDQDVKLQSELSVVRAEVCLLGEKFSEKSSQVDILQTEIQLLEKNILHITHSKDQELLKLYSDLEKKSDETNSLKTLVNDLKNELKVQQRKYHNAMKDTNREIAKLKRKVEHLETSRSIMEHNEPEEENFVDANYEVPHSSHWNVSTSNTFVSQGSNASSTTSLNTVDCQNTNEMQLQSQLKCTELSTSSEDSLFDPVLLERVIRMKKLSLKKDEKIEFLEEHVAQLVVELQKKSKILHHYFWKEEPGALIDHKSDSAKAEIMKRGGIMASVYGSTSKDGAMTLDLSLEINKKLQAVLEDTLLKNITLKDNLNTLADEVATLTIQNSKHPGKRVS